MTGRTGHRALRRVAAATLSCLATAGLAAGLASEGAASAATTSAARTGGAATSTATTARTSTTASTASPGTGFWSGTDSNYIQVDGPPPYSEPAIGGVYGGYMGMVGNWANWQGCGGTVVWSKTDSAHARTNFVTYHDGIGVGDYWFMAGPGVDPHYNGTTAEASAWGAAQAAETLKLIGSQSPAPNYPVIIMDIELPGNAPKYTPAQDNGWNSVYTSPCSGVVKPGQTYVPATVDRADYSGYADYLVTHSSYKVGVYSAPSIWGQIFGDGAPSRISSTWEWTYEPFTNSLANPPSGWCLSGTSTCAQFFGGMSSSSKYALMWQWSGGGGSFNGVGDFDQINGARTP
jgi:hypothetical protein